MRHRPRRNNCVLSPPVSGHNPGTDDMVAGQLTKMLKAHQVWQSSGGTEGHRAHRDHANLEETPNLAGANLQRAILNSASFANSDLTDADFQGAELSRTNFAGAGLRR